MHFSVAVAGFDSMHKSQVQGPCTVAGGAAGAGARVKVKVIAGREAATRFASSCLLSFVIVGRVKVKKGNAGFVMRAAVSRADKYSPSAERVLPCFGATDTTSSTSAKSGGDAERSYRLGVNFGAASFF